MRLPSAADVRLLVLVCLFCTGSVAGLPGAATQSEIHTDGAVGGDGSYFQQNDSETGTPIRHENPDDAAADDSTAELREALASRLGQRLEQSSINLSEGQYEQAEAALGDEYGELLSQYADVTAEDDDGGTSAESFSQAQTQQRAVAENVAAYQRTYQAYQEAKAAGNDRRARELARELLSLETTIQQNASALNTSYTELEETAEVNVSTERQQLQTTSQNVSDIQAQVQETEFTETQLSARSVSPNGSFADPIEISGVLRTEDGDPVRSRNITVAVGSQRYPVRTTDTGSFTLSYRPVTQPLDAETVTVQYEPATSSLYLGSNASVNVSLSQTTATVRVQYVSETGGFGDRITIRGSVTVAETAVSDLPLRARIGEQDQPFGDDVTTTNGSFTISERLSSTVRVGEQPLTITSPQQNRSLAVSPVSTTVEIISRSPSLTATAYPRGNESLVLTGRLSGPENSSLPNQPLQVRAGNETITEFSTDATGTYERAISLETIPANASTLTVQYAPSESNLATTTAMVTIPSRAASTQPGLVSTLLQPLPAILLVGAILSLSGGGVYVYRQRRSAASTSDEIADSPASTDQSATDPDSNTPTEPRIEAATAALDRGDVNTAVVTAYTAIRAHIADQHSVPTQSTHWQFYDAAVEQGLTPTSEFNELTVKYEQARYAPVPVTEATATEIIEIAARIDATLGTAVEQADVQADTPSSASQTD